jgi:hypothetical protein
METPDPGRLFAMARELAGGADQSQGAPRAAFGFWVLRGIHTFLLPKSFFTQVYFYLIAYGFKMC